MRIFLALLLISGALFALEEFQIEDQFGKPLVVDKQTRYLIIATTKENGKQMQSFLDTKEPGFLERKNAVYISDIRAAPSFVVSVFMKPAFKRYGFRMGLLEDDALAEKLPLKPGKITLMKLDNLKEQKVLHLESLKVQEL